MNGVGSAFTEALGLLISGDPALWEIVGVSFSVSLRAILVATPPALVVGYVLAWHAFPGRRLLVSLFETLLALPAVVVGLTVYLLLSRRGPLGDLGWLFTQPAMIVGQIVLAFPILVAMSRAAFRAVDPHALETVRTLGAGSVRGFTTLAREAQFGLGAAVIAAFGRVIAEVGSSMMVGGNILHHTRNIPTAIALETSKGSFAQGIALGLVLLTLALGLNMALGWFQARGAAHP